MNIISRRASKMCKTHTRFFLRHADRRALDPMSPLLTLSVCTFLLVTGLIWFDTFGQFFGLVIPDPPWRQSTGSGRSTPLFLVLLFSFFHVPLIAITRIITGLLLFAIYSIFYC